MSLPLGLVEVAILGLVAFAVFSAVVTFLPRPIRPSQITDNPEVREAFRGNLIQILTLILVALGAAVALRQLSASIDELQVDRLAQIADEIERVESRLEADDSDVQLRVDAIKDLARLHGKSPEHHDRIESDLLRFVRTHAQRANPTTGRQPAGCRRISN